MKWLGLGVIAVALVALLVGIINHQRLSEEFKETSPEALAKVTDSSVFTRIEYTCKDDLTIEYRGVITDMHGELSWDEANELEKTLDQKLGELIARTDKIMGAMDEIGVTGHDVDEISAMEANEFANEAAVSQALISGAHDSMASSEPYLNERAELKTLLRSAAKHGWIPEEKQPCTTAMAAGGILLVVGLGLTVFGRRRKP